jgi:DNA-binding IclR family transcriptional regulator
VARPHLRRLIEQTSATVLLGTWQGSKITIIDKEEPVSDVRVAASVGMQLPFCAGAFGKAFLAYLPVEMIDQLLVEPGLRAFTPTSITSPDQYRAALAEVRAQGYAVDDTEEYLLDVGAIAAPIFQPALIASGSKDEVAGVVTLVSFSSRLSPDKIADYIPLVVTIAREISEKLGVPVNR